MLVACTLHLKGRDGRGVRGRYSGPEAGRFRPEQFDSTNLSGEVILPEFGDAAPLHLP